MSRLGHRTVEAATDDRRRIDLYEAILHCVCGHLGLAGPGKGLPDDVSTYDKALRELVDGCRAAVAAVLEGERARIEAEERLDELAREREVILREQAAASMTAGLARVAEERIAQNLAMCREDYEDLRTTASLFLRLDAEVAAAAADPPPSLILRHSQVRRILLAQSADLSEAEEASEGDRDAR